MSDEICQTCTTRYEEEHMYKVHYADTKNIVHGWIKMKQ
jgi:hypothetical protein